MEQNEQEQRSSAAKEFQESLDQLQHLLEENPTEEQQTPESQVEKKAKKEADERSPRFDLAEWEDAVADIEQYFESKNKEI